MFPFKLLAIIVPSLEMVLSVSIILKTRSPETIPICNWLNLSAICLKGLNNICAICTKAITVPGPGTAASITCLLPNQTIKPIPIDDKISATGKKIEKYQMVFIWASLCLLLICLKLLYSIFSRLKSCTIFIPVTRSCTKPFKLAT